MPSPSSAETEARLRIILCSLAVLTFLFIPVELFLLGHTETWLQCIPFIACFFGLVAAGWVLVSPTIMRISGARILSAGISLSAVVGSIQHFRENLALEIEIRPGAVWTDVIWDALHGSAPTLATGILVLGSLLVVGATYRHPALSKDA
jgi:hypothetical protein